MCLFKIGIFNIDYALIIIFFIGVLIGLIIFGIVFLSLKLSSKKNKRHIIRSKQEIKREDIDILVSSAIDKFDAENDKGETPTFNICYKVSKDLLIDISKMFFPKSKTPLLELSIDEFIDLLNDISVRVDYEIENYHMVDEAGYLTNKVNNIAINFVKKKTIGEIVTMVSKKEVEESPLHKKENAFIGLFKRSFSSIKTSIVNKGISSFKILNNLSKIIIYIVGEESFKVFYKKLYNKDVVSIDDKNSNTPS